MKKKKKQRNFVAKELASRLYAQKVVPNKKLKLEDIAVELEGTEDDWYESIFD